MGFGFSGMTDDDLLAELGGPSSKQGMKGNTADDIMRELGLDPNADENMDDDALLAEIDRKAAMKPIEVAKEIYDSIESLKDLTKNEA